jgi:hypothetical protein
MVIAISEVAQALNIILQCLEWGHFSARFAMSTMIIANHMKSVPNKIVGYGRVATGMLTHTMYDTDDRFTRRRRFSTL